MTKKESVERWTKAKKALIDSDVRHGELLNARRSLEQQADQQRKAVADAIRTKDEALDLFSEGKGSEAAYAKVLSEWERLSDKLSTIEAALASNDETLNRLMAARTNQDANLAWTEREMFASLIPDIKADIMATVGPKMRFLFAISERAGNSISWPPDVFLSRELFGANVRDHDELRRLYSEAKRLLGIEDQHFTHTPHGIGTERDPLPQTNAADSKASMFSWLFPRSPART